MSEEERYDLEPVSAKDRRVPDGYGAHFRNPGGSGQSAPEGYGYGDDAGDHQVDGRRLWYALLKRKLTIGRHGSSET